MRHIACTLILAAIPATSFAQTAQDEEDKGYLTNLIEENLSGAGRSVNIVGFQGALSSEASLTEMTIADDDGVWLTLENVVLDWNRAALLRGRIDITELSAERIIVARAPVADTTMDAPSPEAQPFSLPELPVSIELGSLQIDRIELGESFLGEPINISLTGNASLASGDGSANVTATRLDATTGRFVIEGSYSNETRDLMLNLDVTEGQDGIAARLLDLPGRPSLGLTVAGSGPIETFAADIALATDNQDRVAGTFARTLENDLAGFALDVGGDLTPLLEPAYQDFFGTDVALIAQGRQLVDGRFDLSAINLSAQRLQLSGNALIGAEGWPERIDLTGDISDPTGASILLPLSGPQTFVGNVDLNIAYNQAISDNWTADFIVNEFDRPGLFIDDLALSGGGLLRPGEGTQTGEVTVDLRYEATGLELDDPGSSEAFGDTISGVIQARRIEDEPTEISNVTLRGPGLELDARATIDTSGTGAQIDSTVLLKVAALDRFSTLAGRALAGAADVTIQSVIDPLNGLYDITVDGGTSELQVDVAQVDPLLAGDGTVNIVFVRDTTGTRLENLNIATDEATITANADITSVGSDARFNARIRDISVVEPSLAGAVVLGGTVNQTGAGVIDFDITGTGPDATISADGTAIPVAGGYRVTSDVTADVADLETYAALAGQPLDGAIDATLSGVLQTDGLLFDGQMTAHTTDIVTGVAQVDPLLAGTGTVSVDLARTSATAYRARNLEVRLPDVRIDADADVDTDGPIDATFDLALTDVGLIVDEISGPVTARGTAQRGADGLAAIDVIATAPGVAATVDVTVAQANNAINGTVNATVDELSDYASLIGRPVGGSVQATIEGALVPDLSAFDLTLDVTTNDLETGIAQADPLLAGRGQVNAIARRSSDGIDVPQLRVTTPQMRLDAVLNATADGIGRGTYDARINNVGLIANGLTGPATAKGTASQSPDGTWSVISDLSAPGATANADIAIAPETNEISGTVTAAINNLAPYQPLIGQPVSGGVTANVAGRLLPDLSRFAADVTVETRDVSIGNATADLLLRGLGNLDLSAARTAEGISISNLNVRTNNVSLTGNLDTTNGGNSQGTFEARLRDVGLFTDQLSGPVTANGTASVNESGTIGLDIDGTGPGGITMSANGTIAGSNLDIDASGLVPLGLANAALDPRRIDGNATFDLSIDGPAALDSVSGSVSVDGARLSAPTLGQALENISGNVALANGRADINVRGNVQTGGRVTVTGPVALTGSLQADIGVALRNVVLRDPELYETTINGTITVSGPLSGGARIAGALEMGQTDVQVPSSGVGSLGDLPEVVHIGDSAAVARTLDRAGVSANGTEAASSGDGGGAAFPLDIVVNAPSRIFIRGRGLDAELGGTLQLGGTTANIIPVGQFSLIRGRLDILQQRFELTEGVASLQGDFSPFIRLVAVTEARTGTVIRIIVEGPADAPEVSFESTPQLPQDEVLAQLIFGRDLSEISPLQAVQLAAAVGTLAGRGGGGLIDNFRQGIGLDDFDVTTDEDGNAAVRAGAYLSENVYTDVTINAQGDTEINLNLDITSEITAKGTVNQDGDTSLGVFFERDY